MTTLIDDQATWTSKDCLLYALGVGAGASDPTGFELEFTTENSDGVTQRALPTMPVVIAPHNAGPGPMAAIGTFDWAMLVHGEQSITLHQPLPVEGTAMITGKVAAMYDKGKAGVVVIEYDAKTPSGDALWTNRMSAFIRGEGGWGGDRGPSGPTNVAPDRDPDHVVSYTTRTDQALLYRLNGDRNPLHSDPVFAARAGFPKPILHGLCTLRLHRPCVAARGVRQRSGALQGDRRPLLASGDARRHARREGLGRRQRRDLPDLGGREPRDRLRSPHLRVSPTQVVSAAEAAALIQPRDAIGIPLGPGQPGEFLHALGARDDWDELVVHGALLVDLYEVFTRRGVIFRTGFMGPAERFLRDSGAIVEFVPADFRRFALVAERHQPRVMATAATAIAADGTLSLSLHAGATVDELHRAGADPDRLLVVEANARLPRTFGAPPNHSHTVHIDEIDVLIESEREPFVIADPPATAVDAAIARNAMGFVHDGATIQTGIGGVPNLIATLLAEGPGSNYGVHSEMFTTGLMQLHQAGKVTNANKGIHEGVSVCTFAAGTRELYDWLDGNGDVRFLPVQLVNDPAVIAANHGMVTINGAIAVDLLGQVAADTIGHTQYSGIGGHEDFVAMSGFQLEDRSLVCLPSTATVDSEPVSRITPDLPTGTAVTTPRHQIDVVITEWGAAELAGRTVKERAHALAEIAHPDFRSDLHAAAARFG